MSKEYFGFQSFGNENMSDELAAVIGGYRPYLSDIRQQHKDKRLDQSLGVLHLGQLSGKREIGVTFHQSHSDTLDVVAHDCIHIEVSGGEICSIPPLSWCGSEQRYWEPISDVCGA